MTTRVRADMPATSPAVVSENVECLWQDLLPETDRSLLERGSYGEQQPLEGPAGLLLVDFQLGYLGDDANIIDQLAQWPTGGGAEAWQAMRAASRLAEAARMASVPVILTRIAYRDMHSAHRSTFTAKRGPRPSFIDGAPATQIAAELAPHTADLIITKTAASAFHDTDLHSRLRDLGVTSLLIGGLSTSGCVRATVVDAAAHGYKAAVVVEATADRMALSRRVAFLDIWMKYGSVIWLHEGLQLLRQMRETNQIAGS